MGGAFVNLHPLLKLQLLILLLFLPPIVSPVGGGHELLAFVLNVSVVLVLLAAGLELVVDARVHQRPVSFPLFSPLARPPDADDDAEDPEQAEDHTQYRHQVVCAKREGQKCLSD